MSGYNTQFTMADFFMNPRLEKVLPQFSVQELSYPSDQLLNERAILNKVSEYLAVALGGERVADGITVKGDYTATMAKIRGLASVCEGIFSSSDSIAKNVRRKSKVYTTVSTISQVARMESITQKTALMQQILENINYNKDFNSLGSVSRIEHGQSRASFARRQQLWENKVNYKQDPRLARMNASTKWHR